MSRPTKERLDQLRRKTKRYLEQGVEIPEVELFEEIDALKAEKQELWIDKHNLESADSRYEFLYEITHEEIDSLKRRIGKLREALELSVKYDPSEHDDKTCAGFMTVVYCNAKKTLKEDELEARK